MTECPRRRPIRRRPSHRPAGSLRGARGVVHQLQQPPRCRHRHRKTCPRLQVGLRLSQHREFGVITRRSGVGVSANVQLVYELEADFCFLKVVYLVQFLL